MTKKGYVVGALVGLVLGIVLTTMFGGYFIKVPERITWTATQIQTLFSPTTVRETAFSATTSTETLAIPTTIDRPRYITVVSSVAVTVTSVSTITGTTTITSVATVTTTSETTAATTIFAHIAINEVELNPPEDDRYSTTMEWVELYNPDPYDVNIGGWTLSTTHGETVTVIIPQETWMPASGFYVVNSARWLDNEGESIILRSTTGRVVDSTGTFDDTADDYRAWARVPDGTGAWSFQGSTKGSSNG